MQTALLAQNDNTVIENLKQNVGRSVFDLSHSTAFPIDVDGAILPICCIETVPSDSFEISVECMLRQLSPLKVPLFTNLRLNTAFYYCDNRLAWKKWDRFMTGGRSGNEVYNLPKIYTATKSANSQPKKYTIWDSDPRTSTTTQYESYNVNYKNSLHTYFNFSFNRTRTTEDISYDNFPKDNDELPLAFAFFDYQIICRDDYTDVDRLPQTPLTATYWGDHNNPFSDWAYQNLFPQDDDEIKLSDGPQIRSGFRSGDDTTTANFYSGFCLDKVRYHNVRDDYFVSSKKAPMRGDAPTIALSSTSGSIDFSKSVAVPNSNVVLPVNYNQIVAAASSTDPDNVQHNNQLAVVDTNLKAVNTDIIVNALNKAELNIQVNSEITASQIRLLSQLTVWKELNMLHKPYYNDFLNAHFSGVRVGESPVERPQYIGGTSQLIQINQIVQQSASTDSSPLGTQGAVAQSLENNYVGKFYCNNYGYIIGVAYIQVDMMYKPAIPRHFSRRAKEDYYSPEFANLSMQAILNKEMFYSNDSDWNNTPWGYTGAFDEMRSIPNHIAGDLLNSSYTDLQAWALTRSYSNDNKPSMSSEWLSLKGNVDKTAWSVPNMPAFMLQCANYIKAVRPMPYLAIPKAL